MKAVKNQRGSALMVVMFLMIVTLAVCAGALTMSYGALQSSRTVEPVEQQYYTAEAAAQYAMSLAIIEADNYRGVSAPYSEVYEYTGALPPSHATLKATRDAAIEAAILASFSDSYTFSGINADINSVIDVVSYYLQTDYEQPGEYVWNDTDDEWEWFDTGPPVYEWTYFVDSIDIKITAKAGGRAATVDEKGQIWDISAGDSVEVTPSKPEKPSGGGGGSGGPSLPASAPQELDGTHSLSLGLENLGNLAVEDTIHFQYNGKIWSGLDIEYYPEVKATMTNSEGTIKIIDIGAEMPDIDIAEKMSDARTSALTGTTLSGTLTETRTGTNIYASSDLTLGSNTDSFIVNNAPGEANRTYIYVSGNLDINITRGITLNNVTIVGYNQITFTGNAGTNDVSMDATFYSNGNIQGSIMVDDKWKSTPEGPVVPNFIAQQMIRLNITGNCPMGGIFYSRGNNVEITFNIPYANIFYGVFHSRGKTALQGTATINFVPVSIVGPPAGGVTPPPVDVPPFIIGDGSGGGTPISSDPVSGKEKETVPIIVNPSPGEGRTVTAG